MGGDIIGEINFIRQTAETTDGATPFFDGNPKLGWTTSNYILVPTRIPIHDLRGKENTVDLDTHGFEILKYNGQVHDLFDDNSETQRTYYEDVANALKNRLGASRVVIFNHINRARGAPRPTEECNPSHKNAVFFPHVDIDPPAAGLKLREILGEEEAEKAMQKHFQIMNVWKPLGPNPIINIPLTICDCRTLDFGNDLHSTRVQGSPNAATLYLVSCDNTDAQKWYYLSEMRSNEMFVFKVYDSNPDVAQVGAHTAFRNESVPSTDIEQHSIEMRCIVLYDE